LSGPANRNSKGSIGKQTKAMKASFTLNFTVMMAIMAPAADAEPSRRILYY
jgi:hypothetical protein